MVMAREHRPRKANRATARATTGRTDRARLSLPQAQKRCTIVSEPDMKGLQRLLRAMAQPRTFYVIGAGASYGLVPTTAQMRSAVERDYHAFGMYPTKLSHVSALHDRIIGRASPDFENFEPAIREMFLQTIRPPALDFLVQKTLYLPLEAIVPPQYAIFDAVGAPATLFSFNLDGLATRFCRHKHIVLEPHGRVDHLWFEDNPNAWLTATLAFDVKLPYVTPKLLPSPEPAHITRTYAYQRARCLLPLSPAVVIVGYSFGRTSNGMDDSESWRFFVRELKALRCPVFVVSPTPSELVGMLREAMSIKSVFGVPLFWETFSTCLIVAARAAGLPANWCDQDLNRLIDRYERALERR